MSEDDCALCAGFESVRVVEATLLHFTPPAHTTPVIRGCQYFLWIFFGEEELGSEAARAAHRAVVAGLAAGVDRALLFVFEELNQLRDGGFLDPKSFLAGMLNQLRIEDWGLRTAFFTEPFAHRV